MPDRLTEIEARLEKATKGPWRWFGGTKSHRCYLATIYGGRKLVMDFVRWGMSSAAPRFQVNGTMRRVEELAELECEYRDDIDRIDHADAELIASAPSDIAWLVAEVKRLSRGCETCAWTEDEDGSWDTACGDKFIFTDGGPAENGCAFCPYCGSRLKIARKR